jgi:4-hydroxy-3-methylbut-2-enyl diphosphate reductase
MEVLVAEKCGFCHGVRSAIRMAEQTLSGQQGRGKVYSFGQIIHNTDEVERLARAGLETVATADEVESGTVIIRSHGAAPQEIAELRDRGLNIVDATCVLVKRVQQIAQELERDGYKVVVIGDQDHPEVQAVVGCVRDVVVVGDELSLDNLPTDGKLGVVCQTTQGLDRLADMLRAIGKHGFGELKVINTLCRESMKRQESAIELCKRVDVMFVLGGLQSANTRKLAELCKAYNSETYHLQNWNELETNVLKGKGTAGVTAGASTPDRVIEEFVENLRGFPGSS